MIYQSLILSDNRNIMITERQEKLLNFLIKEYISTAEPVSSFDLKKITDWDICGATIRNDLQKLTKQGFIEQPHTSSGRIPTKKAYKYFVAKISSEREEEFSNFIAPACRQASDKLALPDFIVQQIKLAHQQIEEEMKLAEQLMKSLSETSTTLNYTRIQNKNNLFEILEILGPSKNTHNENIDLINEILKKIRRI